MKKIIVIMVVMSFIWSSFLTSHLFGKLISNQSENFDVKNTVENICFDLKSKNEKIEYFLQNRLNIISTAILELTKDATFREIVYKEVNKEFDGEPNVLLTKVIYLYNKKGFDIIKQMENRFYDTYRMAYRINISKILRTLRRHGKYINIYIPCFENKRLKNSIRNHNNNGNVYVVTNKLGFDVQSLYGKYFNDRNSIKFKRKVINEKFAYNNEVWVIGFNERIDRKGKLRKEVKTFLKEEKKYKNKYYNTKNMNGLFSTKGNGRMCQIEKIKCLDLDEIEGWLRGGPELCVKVFDMKKNRFAHMYFYTSRSNARSNNWYVNRWLGFWDYDNRGTELYFSWYEQDGGNLTKVISINWKPKDSAFSILMNHLIGNGDEDAFGMSIHKDYYNHIYNTGLIEWKMKNN